MSNCDGIEKLVRHFREDDDSEVNVWIGDDYPAMNILAKGRVAYLHYFPTARHPGFKSLNGCAHSKMVLINSEEDIVVSDDSLLDAESTLAAAHEFECTHKLPVSVSWLEL